MCYYLRGGDKPIIDSWADGEGSITITGNAKQKPTPMMAQYWAIKREHEDSLLFYRMGDFYELFFEDAVLAASALDIALTKRGQHEGMDVPMCGVPVHSHETYLQKLIKGGFRVAICEQLETPVDARKRGYKALVKRDVVRVITPGTLTEEGLLDARANNHLAAVTAVGSDIGLAWIDISTGSFSCAAPSLEDLDSAIAQIAPGELLIPDTAVQDGILAKALREWKPILTFLPQARFGSRGGESRLKEAFAVLALEGFGAFKRAELGSCGALLEYVRVTQKGQLPHLSPPKKQKTQEVMGIDSATRRSLEIAVSLDGSREKSLLGAVDFTCSSSGARLLAARLMAPVTDPDLITERLDEVEWLVDDAHVRSELRKALRSCPDLERALARLTLNRGGPRDLSSVQGAIATGGQIRALLSEGETAKTRGLMARYGRFLNAHQEISDILSAALAPDLPLLARGGGFIAEGFSECLDGLRLGRDESRRLIRDLENRYRLETGLPVLKIKQNNILGYFIEVRPAQADKVPASFLHRQTLANSVRFTSLELGELEKTISSSASDALALELKLFQELVNKVCDERLSLTETAATLAALDVAVGFAQLAVDRNYVRPVVDNSLQFNIDGGRHPVVEAKSDTSQGDVSFIPNNCNLDPEQRLWLITGPNMAGKSTFLRQNALIAVLAQTGSFIPAKAGHIGVVDRLFSRVGAADDLARGRSTFMVEMIETAAILNQSSERSLVVLDEIGRGTATYDGLSIAWATVEYLHTHNKCRSLFATHFHELTALSSRLNSLACYYMRVKEWEDTVIFMYEVATGSAERSYGIQVARLAGLPAQVLKRAQEVLAELEQEERGSDLTLLTQELPLFSVTNEDPDLLPIDPLRERLQQIEPDSLTPREALDALYNLRALMEADE
ncbi:MAG: DNA mismatch repair protein MutS [Pseudomonadota bacterium]|nr:DNA mismatch repair protein MutS [Pseudomonadota bacterium]